MGMCWKIELGAINFECHQHYVILLNRRIAVISIKS